MNVSAFEVISFDAMNRDILEVLKLGKKGSFVVVLLRLDDHGHVIGSRFGNLPFVHLEGYDQELLGIEFLYQLVERLLVFGGELYREKITDRLRIQ